MNCYFTRRYMVEAAGIEPASSIENKGGKIPKWYAAGSLALLLLLSACGGDKGDHPVTDLRVSSSIAPEKPSYTVVWEGYVSEDPKYLELYQRVESCVGVSASEPYLILTESTIGNEAEGTTHFIPDYIMVHYAGMNNTNGMFLAHEYVHYLLRRGNELHGTETMNTCGRLEFPSN